VFVLLSTTAVIFVAVRLRTIPDDVTSSPGIVHADAFGDHSYDSMIEVQEELRRELKQRQLQSLLRLNRN